LRAFRNGNSNDPFLAFCGLSIICDYVALGQAVV
jgi:hypothetical protein